eukprot:GDKJ01024391.1.p1 GENE.GDKJ01024391.1~~GDKJ01024391.1.p1  ORF type:complete len:317 (-),score=55.29 GDKJ01024391.1:82-1032(-)
MGKGKAQTNFRAQKKLNREKEKFKSKKEEKRAMNTSTLLSTASAYDHLSASTSNPKSIQKCKYSADQSILLVGDGDFSFSRALALMLLPNVPKKGKLHIIATSYDNYGELMKKYGNSVKVNTNELRNLGVVVMHTVDATQLDADPRLRNYMFDRVIFNFPHLGGSQDADVAANCDMLAEFLNSARKMLRPFTSSSSNPPEIHISLRDTPFYNKWDVRKLAADRTSMKISEVQPFDAEPYVTRGYAPVRTNPAAREAPSLENAKVFIARPKGADMREKRRVPYEPRIRESLEEEEEEENVADSGGMDLSLRELLGLD